MKNKKNTKKKPVVNKANIREELQELCQDEELLFMTETEYDPAIIGVIKGKAHVTAVAYDYDKVIDANIKMGMSYDEAVEFFYCNQIDAYVGKNTPVFIYRPI